MALSAPVKALALVVFIAAIAGATYGVSMVTGDTVGSQLVTATLSRAEANATPGHDVTYFVAVNNRGAATRDVVVEIDGIVDGRSEMVSVRGNSTGGIFVTVQVPEGTPEGEHALDVRLLDGTELLRERSGAAVLRILPPAPGLEPGDTAELIYTGRLTATGRVFNTNDPELLAAQFAKTDNYRFSQGLLPLQTTPRPNIVPGLYEGLLGMQPGEHRTVSFGPEKGYGPATEEINESRDEVIVRDLTLVNDVQRVARATFDTYITESRQGDPTSYQPNDTFTLEQNGNDWPYKVAEIDDEVVGYRLAAVVGDAYTVYPFWPNASVVTSIDDDHVSFRTTPTTAINETFTMKAFWPEMSAIRDVNETRVIVRHTPPVGFTYTMVSQLGQAREATIKEVSESRIVVAIPSPNPLAGRDLTFDVIMMTLDKA